jgi:uncharacterized protein (UPF0210 family)
MGQKGFDVDYKTNAMMSIYIRTITYAIKLTPFTDDEIAESMKSIYDDSVKEKKEILKDAASVIEQWSKLY